MSLVDYASSSDDDEALEVREEHREEPQVPKVDPRPPEPRVTQTKFGISSDQQPKKTQHSSPPLMEKLPDASLLLNAPAVSSNMMNASDHSSRVAAAMAENASRKRDSNGLVSSTLRRKVPRGSLPHSRNVTDTGGGVLVPPQISGRSNIVTEDIGKLFVKKQNEHSSH